MSTDNIFEEKKTEGDPLEKKTDGNPSNAQPTDDFADLLSSVKNERGEQKYKNVKDALIGLQNAQSMIPTLLREKQEQEQEVIRLRNEMTEVETLKATVEQLLQKSSEAPTNAKATTEEDIAKLVNQTLEKRQAQATAASNTQSVVQAAKDKYGDKAQAVFEAKAEELGFTVAEFSALAGKSPKVVLQALDVSKPTQKNVSPNSGTINMDAFTPQKDSLIGRNTKEVLIGATSQELLEESRNAKKMVDELAEQGLDMTDMSNPKNYYKYFGKR